MRYIQICKQCDDIQRCKQMQWDDIQRCKQRQWDIYKDVNKGNEIYTKM